MLIFMEKERFESLRMKELENIINKNKSDLKYKRLLDYYKAEHDILTYSKRNKKVPNNRLINNIPKYIVDTGVGYFMGKPIVYSSKNEEFLNTLQKIFDYNDEQDHNIELAKSTGIYGSAFEMIYLDENADIRFTILSPDDVIMIVSTDLKEVLGAIRLIRTRDHLDKTYIKIEFWDSHCVSYYNYKEEKLEFVDEIEHYYHDVPFVEYINNEERKGDFEDEISLVDAYNRVQSNTANMFQYNDEALLMVRKLGDVSDDDIKQMKEDGVVVFPEDGDMNWLLKTIDDTALENYKKRIRDDIHIFSNVPNLNDENFGGNLSGVAVGYKLWGMEQKTAIKERKFKKGLQRRIELITNILNIKGGNFNYMDIEISFRRNKPQNILEIAQIITMLSGELSRETKLAMLPNVLDVKKEIEKIEEEKSRTRSDFGLTNEFIESIGRHDEK